MPPPLAVEPLVALCTKEQVRALGVDAPDDQLDLLIAASSAAVRAACGWAITEQLDVVLSSLGVGGTTSTLPTLWLRAVHEVTVDGTALTGSVPRFDHNGVLYLGVCRGHQLAAKVDHGYTEPPPDLAMATAGMVARTVASPVGVVGERVGAWSVNYDASPFAPNASRSAVRVTAADLDTLAPYTLPKVP